MATKKETTKKTTSSTKRITKQQIRKRAQEIFEDRIARGIEGDEESDWLQAEKELLN